MRREINIRKRKRILLKNANIKSLKLLIILGFIIILCIILYAFFFQNYFINNNFEKDNLNFSYINENIPFSINKIILFSSATADVTNVNQSIQEMDISQYCDIGIYINNSSVNSSKISSLYIDNIVISKPEIGTPCLYKKCVSDLGKCSFDENLIISDRFDFNVIDSNSEINYSNFNIYNDGSTPISIGFYNKNIKENFLTDNTQILYNGSLLKEALITTTSLKCNVSLRINIITQTEEHYICNINFDIPFEDNENSIYETGYITKEITSNSLSKFIRIK